MKNKLMILAAVLAMAACGGNAQRRTANGAAPDGHTAQTSLDYEGTYVGTFPAADCPGIETTLRLKRDGTYALHQKYIDRDAEFDENGTYTVQDNLLTLAGEQHSYYKIEENRLRRLDAAKQPVTGALADHYILTKKQK